MQYVLFNPPRSVGTHIAEEVLRPFKEVISSRVLCGGIHGGSVFERPIPRDLNRDAWLSPRKEKIDTTEATCKRCLSRYETRFSDWIDVS